MNTSEKSYCGIIKSILIDFEERLKILEKRKQTPITLGRINEIQECILYLQQKIIKNIKKIK